MSLKPCGWHRAPIVGRSGRRSHRPRECRQQQNQSPLQFDDGADAYRFWFRQIWVVVEVGSVCNLASAGSFQISQAGCKVLKICLTDRRLLQTQLSFLRGWESTKISTVPTGCPPLGAWGINVLNPKIKLWTADNVTVGYWFWSCVSFGFQRVKKKEIRGFQFPGILLSCC